MEKDGEQTDFYSGKINFAINLKKVLLQKKYIVVTCV